MRHTHTQTHTHTDTHTHTHDDSIRRNAMRCISPKNHKTIYCDICKWVHKSCTKLNKLEYNFLAATDEDYFCWKCISDIFAIPLHCWSTWIFECNSEFLFNFPIFSNFISHKQQLHTLNNKTVLKNDDIDQDKNIYNLLQEDCRYYLPSELQNAIDKADIINNQSMSIIHINARSMLAKLGQIDL